MLYGQSILDTLHQRVGQGRWPGDSKGIEDDAKRTWGRFIGLHGERERLKHRYLFRSAEFDYNFNTFQLGRDLYVHETEQSRLDWAGLYVALGRATGNVQRRNNFRFGSYDFNAYTVGGYWTIYKAQQAYLDMVLQATWYDASSRSYRLYPLVTHGQGFAGSIEGGYPFIFEIDG